MVIGLGLIILSLVGLKRGRVIALQTYRINEDEAINDPDAKEDDESDSGYIKNIHVGAAARWMSYGYGVSGVVLIVSGLLSKEIPVFLASTLAIVMIVLIGAHNIALSILKERPTR